MSHVGEPLKIDKTTYNIIGAKTGAVYGSGTGDTPEAKLSSALALQTQLASGGTPTVAGRPDLYALAPTAAEGTPQAITGANGQPVMPTVATPEQLAQQRAGTLTSFNKATGGTPPPAGATPEAPVAPTAPPQPPTNFADATQAALKAGAEARKTELLGAPDSYDNQILRQKAAMMSKMFGQDLTPDDLKWLTPAQSQAVLSGDERLIKSEIAALNTITQGRKDMKKEEEDRATKQYDLFAKSGTPPDQLPQGFLQGLDEKLGVPPGTHEAIYKSDYAAQESERESAKIDAAKKIVDLVNDLPLGQEITIGDSTYTGLSTKGIMTGTEESTSGDVTLWTYNPATDEYQTKDLGNIGKSSGWEVKRSSTGVTYRENTQTGERAIVYDPNTAGGAIPQGGLFDAFPDGSKGGECGTWVRGVTGMRIVDPNAVSKGIDPNSYQSKLNVMDKSITPDLVQPGDVFVQSAGVWTGHTGIITAVHNVDGEITYDVKESNWHKDGTVDTRTNVPAEKMGGFARPGIKPEYQWGSDANGSTDLYSLDSGGNGNEDLVTSLASQYAVATTETERTNILAKAKTLNVEPRDVETQSHKVQLQPGTYINKTTNQPIDLTADQKNALPLAKTTIDSYADLLKRNGEIASSTKSLEALVPYRSPKEREQIIGFKADLERFNAEYQKAMSGLTVSDKEAVRFERILPQPNDTRLVRATKIKRAMKYLADARANTLATLGATELIKVKEKSTGQTGVMPESEFNNSAYERL